MTDRSRIDALTREHIVLAPYDVTWPARYLELETLLQRSLPPGLATRIAHIGSTAVPGMNAKPIIDVQVEVTNLDRVCREVVPIMNDLGFEYIWRPTIGEQAPFYAWFIARNASGQRTAHIHMVESDSASEDRIRFRDFLRSHPQEAERYAHLKQALLEAHPSDRAAFTAGKSAFVADCLQKARTTIP